MSDRPLHITLHKRVKSALDALSPQEKQTVSQTLMNLANYGIETAISDNIIKKLKIDEPLYLLLINPNWRAILNMDNPDEIKVLDLMTHDRLEIFAAANN